MHEYNYDINTLYIHVIHVDIQFDLFVLRYTLQYQEPVPLENMIATICDVKQAYTQFGGKLNFVGIFSKFKVYKLPIRGFNFSWPFNYYIHVAFKYTFMINNITEINLA